MDKETQAPIRWLLFGVFCLFVCLFVVGWLVVEGDAHMRVHMILWLNHKSPELGLNLSGS